MWGLTGRNRVWCFLQLDDLFVHKARPVVNDLHRIRRITYGAGTFGRLGDPTTIDVDLDCMIADLAFEEGIFHIGDDRRGSNYKSFDCNNPVHVYLELVWLVHPGTGTYQKD